MNTEAVTIFNREQILPLVAEYQESYRNYTFIDETRNRKFYRKFYAESEHGCSFLCKDGDELVGFCTIVYSYESSIMAKVAIMNDLYVREGYRSKGCGTNLIRIAKEHALTKGCVQLQWKTNPRNMSAQVCYDRITSNKSTWVTYTLK